MTSLLSVPLSADPVAGATREPVTLRDLRTTALALAAWAGALVGLSASGWWRTGATLAAAAAAAGTALAAARCGTAVVGPDAQRRDRSGRLRMGAACALVAAVLSIAAGVRADALRASPVAVLAADRAVVRAELVVRSDPTTTSGRYGDTVVTRGTLRRADGRGRSVVAAAPVLVLGGEEWQHVRLGSLVRLTGRLAPADGGDLAAVVTATAAPEVVRGPPAVMRAADGVRAAVRTAAARGPGESRELVPALVTGDDQRLSADLVADFRTAGLTHLTAVSGTNLTLVLGSLLLVARWCGVRARLLPLCGLVGVIGFVLMARPEPSVVRAAAMGTVALLGMGGGGRRSGLRALGAAAFVLLLLDPWLATSAGFSLSVLATGGILLIAPGFRDALAGWAPRWVAEAVSVPVAAQLACTPLVAVLSGEVSLVAVAANVVVAPLVGPATVLGLVGGLVALVLPTVGALVGWAGCWCAQLVIAVAQLAAGLPGAAAEWPTTALGLTTLTVGCLLALAAAPLLRSRAVVLLLTALLVVAVLRPLPSLGWPPPGWVMVMCDVGQGDALVLATGPREAVVVDAGPDPAPVDACLDRLGTDRVPVVVLTHFHADHVDGLPGVLEGREVGEVQVSPIQAPPEGAAAVRSLAAAAGVPVRVPVYGEVVQVGELTWRVVAPRRLVSENPNDGSVVLLVEAAGLRILLTGDVEPESQAPLLREPLAPVDVLKVPHHGSRHQDLRLLTGLGVRVALVSAGAANDYGHPAPSTLDELTRAGALVRSTDEDGDVAVVVRDGELRLAERG